MGNKPKYDPVNVKVKINIQFKPQITVSSTDMASDLNQEKINELLEKKMKELLDALQQIDIRDIDVTYGDRNKRIQPLIEFEPMNDT